MISCSISRMFVFIVVCDISFAYILKIFKSVVPDDMLRSYEITTDRYVTTPVDIKIEIVFVIQILKLKYTLFLMKLQLLAIHDYAT